jgi:hypothetical protein
MQRYLKMIEAWCEAQIKGDGVPYDPRAFDDMTREMNEEDLAFEGILPGVEYLDIDGVQCWRWTEVRMTSGEILLELGPWYLLGEPATAEWIELVRACREERSRETARYIATTTRSQRRADALRWGTASDLS